MNSNRNTLIAKEALNILHQAIDSNGIKASVANTANYSAVFMRDAALSGIVGLMISDKKLIQGLTNTIESFYKFSGEQGQIPSNIDFQNKNNPKISFGTLTPKIDSATWYLVSIGLLSKKNIHFPVFYVQKTIDLLEGLEYNQKGLIYIPQGGNWADEYIYQGYILYDQVLRYWALSLLGKCYHRQDWLKKADFIIEKIFKKFHVDQSKYLISAYTPGKRYAQFDLAAHILLGFACPQKYSKYLDNTIQWIDDLFINKNKLPPVFYPVISKEDAEWEELRNYHLFDFKNNPHHYHNGGVWWIWVGYLSLFYYKSELQNADKINQISFTLLSKIENFNFQEYISPVDNQPYGTTQLCFSAAGILLLSAISNKKIDKELLHND